MNVKQVLMLLLTVTALVLVQSALAKGPPQKVTISGAGLTAEIEVTGDEDILNALAMMTLEDYDTRTPEAPEGIGASLGDGYLITRFYENPPGQYVAFDEVGYYPDPEGGRGYLNYVGIVNGWSEYDGKWFRANPQGETVLQSLISGAERDSTAAPLLNLFLEAIALFVAAN